MEDVLVMYLGLFGVVAVVLTFFLAKMTNPAFRCRMLRRWLKKPYVIVNLVQKDSMLINTYVVNAEKDVLIVGSNMWILSSGRVYLKSKGKKLKEKDIKKKGFSITTELLKTEEGVPTLYVDKDSMKPTVFEGSQKDKVKPDEVGSTLLSWVFNQYQKALAGIAHHKKYLLIILVLSVLCLAVSWTALQGIQRTEEKLDALSARIGGAAIVPEGGTVEGDKITIKQPEGAT